MSDRFRVSSFLARQLEEQNISPSVVLRRAGLPLGLFQQDKIFVTTEELFSLWRAIGESSNDPAVGLKLGAEWQAERYDLGSIAALHSRSFGDGIRRLARYKQLVCPEEIRLQTERGESAVVFVFLLARQAEPTVLLDACLSRILAVGRRGTGGPLTPLRLELTRPPLRREVLETHFGCRVRFGENRNALIFRGTDLDRPFVTHNAELLAVLCPQLDTQLNSRLAHRSTSDRVKAAIKSLLAGRRPSIREVARELNLSSRTLQRRLTESGATFKQLLGETRRELAHYYLHFSSFELNETAYLLGYEDPTSFFRAFQHWEGTSPNRWRIRSESESVPLSEKQEPMNGQVRECSRLGGQHV
jgi:AraC-like DNA-binding protein